MAADPVPLDPGGSGSCEPCNLCCVLNQRTYGFCVKLYWQCNCPDGDLAMLRFDLNVGWVEVPNWVPDGPNHWWPWTPYTGTPGNTQWPGSYRLRCTLPSGEVYFSNEVVVSGAGNLPYCQCSDGSDLKGYGAEIDFSIQPYTASGAYPGTESWGTEIDYTYAIGCQGGLNSPQRVYTFDDPTNQYAEARMFYNSVVGGELICRLTVFPGGVAEGRRDIADLQKGWRCHTACYGFDEFTGLVPNAFYFCRAQNGTPPNTYCSNGEVLKVKAIRMVF